MHALVLLRINQHTKVEVPSFTNSKDMTGQNLKQHGTGTRGPSAVAELLVTL